MLPKLSGNNGLWLFGFAMNTTLWGWEIQKRSGGPHHYLSLRFDAKATELEPLLERSLSQHFELWQGEYQWKTKGSGSGCYTLIELCDNCITITRGWGNTEGIEEEFLQQLLASQPLAHWQVMAGGEGYASQHFRSGHELESFMDYCRVGQSG